MTRSLSEVEAVARLTAKNLEPLEPWHGSTTKPWRVRCLTCGTEGAPRLGSLSTQRGCRTCGYQRVLEKRHEQAKIAAGQTVAELGFTPLEPYPGSKYPWTCRHTCGTVATVIASSVANGNTQYGCPTCRPGQGISQEDASKEMRAAGHKPLEPFVNMKEPWRTVHLECGQERRSTLSHIRAGGIGCYPCSRKSDRWSHPAELTEEQAVERLEAHGFTPVGSYPGAGKPWKVRHSCGAVVTPALSNLDSGTGCKVCNSSFNYADPAVVYLLKHTGFNAVKVGIAGSKRQRLRMMDNTRYGFAVVQTWEVSTGQEAYDIEQRVIRHWRQGLKAEEHVAKEDMPRGGHTETASMRKVGLAKTIGYIDGLLGQAA